MSTILKHFDICLRKMNIDSPVQDGQVWEITLTLILDFRTCKVLHHYIFSTFSLQIAENPMK